ncbi:hypothetical protein FQN50_008822 [Emmonsiellopsis sp. PD_5]|nr:hypothetical protein FQN50_008822 [Emmonsiellopsis sp. PD_5]
MNGNINTWLRELQHEYKLSALKAWEKAIGLKFRFSNQSLSLLAYISQKINLLHLINIYDNMPVIHYLWEGLNHWLGQPDHYDKKNHYNQKDSYDQKGQYDQNNHSEKRRYNDSHQVDKSDEKKAIWMKKFGNKDNKTKNDKKERKAWDSKPWENHKQYNKDNDKGTANLVEVEDSDSDF